MDAVYHWHYFERVMGVFDLVDRYAQDRKVRGSHPRPIGPLQFTVVARDDAQGQRLDFLKPFEPALKRTPEGYYVFFNKGRYSGETPQQHVLEAGRYYVRIDSPFYQRREIQIDLPLGHPDDVQTIELLPGYAYPFPTGGSVPNALGAPLLRGSVHHTDGRGWAGVRVSAANKALYDCITDESGAWVLVFPADQPDETITVRFTFPQNAQIVDVPNVEIVAGQPRSLRETSLRGWVLDAKGVGLSDAAIRVSGQAETVRPRKNGEWFFYFGLKPVAAAVTVTAELPNGLTRTQPGIQLEIGATVVVPTFRF